VIVFESATGYVDDGEVVSEILTLIGKEIETEIQTSLAFAGHYDLVHLDHWAHRNQIPLALS